MPLTGAPAVTAPEGINNPPIDDLLDKVSSKYALVIYAAKRARQINDYYAQLGEGLLEYVGPLVEPGPRERPIWCWSCRRPRTCWPRPRTGSRTTCSPQRC